MRSALTTPIIAALMALPALAGSTTLQVHGTCAGNSLPGSLAGVSFGDAVVMTFEVITPGTDIIPGQYVNYTIDAPTFRIDSGSNFAGCANTNLPIALQNDMPVSDGLRLFFAPDNLQNGYGLGFELGLVGTTFDSTDITEQAGIIDFNHITSYSWEIHGGGSMFIDFLWMEIFPSAAGTQYCFGDGTGTACPCGNTGGAGEGCDNSSGVGAMLGGFGSTSVASDDLSFSATGLIPGQSALLFSANNAVNGGNGILFGDGLRCAGGALVRLGIELPDATGQASWASGMAAAGGWAAGDTRRFQVWYRDPVGSPCGTDFNLSNGVEILFVQ